METGTSTDGTYTAPPKFKGGPWTTNYGNGGAGAGTGSTTGGGIPGIDPFLMAQANAAYQRALAQINSQRAHTLTSYGFMAKGYDASGNPTGLAVDPKSMYGQYQRLLDSQAHASMNAEDAGADRGFSGGLANRAVGDLNYQQGGERLTLGQNLLGDFSNEEQQLLAAQAAKDAAINQAYMMAVQAAQASGNWTPAAEAAAAAQASSGNSGAAGVTTAKPAASSRAAAASALAKKVVAKSVSANRSGATYSQNRGVISIH